MSIADRRERDKQKRRDSIVDAAENLFFAKGFAATTIDEIAEAAELSKGTVYLYFNNKEEIYVAIVRRAIRILIDLSREAVAAASTGGEKVSALGRALLLFYERYPNHFKAMFYQHEGPSCPSSEIDHGDLLINTLIQDREELHAFSLEVIQGGIADGSIRSDVDPIKTTIVLVSMILGLIRIVALEEKPLLERFHLTAQDLIKAAIDLMGRPLTGAQKQKPPNGP
jgi:TetR/AcrR family transcriptional regulator